VAPWVIVVPREARGARVDRFLTLALAATDRAPSRSELQRWIAHGRVRVDGTPCRAKDKVNEGALVEVLPEAPARTEALPDAKVPFDVLHQDDEVIVVYKPPGVVVHPARGHEGGTLVNGLLALGVFAAEEVEGGNERPGIVHRLDKGTSGVMVVARTARAREALKAQFYEHTIDREYVAVCAGAVEARVFRTRHGRKPNDRMRFTGRVKEGKLAVTDVKVLERLAGGAATYVACRLETGRTHQIRVHLAESGTPVLGDPLYGKQPRDERLRKVAERLGHQALHARLLGFAHPTTGERMRFEMEPPADFEAALAELRS
jgi:23S rRNA pseudouridine1911/1915/1917 synthase